MRKLPFAKKMVFDDETHTLPITESCMEKLSPELQQILERVMIDRGYTIPPEYCVKIANCLSQDEVYAVQF